MFKVQKQKQIHSAHQIFLKDFETLLKKKKIPGGTLLWKEYKDELNYKLTDLIVPRKSFTVDEHLDTGGFSTVYKGKYCFEDVAIKVITMDLKSKKEVRNVIKEILLLARVRNPNVISLYGLCLYKNEMFIITEYFEHQSLYHFLSKFKGRVMMADKLGFLLDVAKGMYYLHSLQTPVIHRDMKPHNILIGHDLKAKIADFG